MNRRMLLKLCGAMAVSATRPFASSLAFAQIDAQGNQSTVHRQLRMNLLLSNPLADDLRDQAVWLYFPAQSTATQQLDEVRASVEHRLHTDSLGHSIVELAFPRFPAHARKVVTLTAEVTMRARPMMLSLHNPEAWLAADERFIEVNDPRIQSLAANLARGSPQETSRAIFEWIGANLAYAGYVADDIGALESLIQRRGDCTEFAYLAVALARANRIPARVAGGYVIEQDAVLRAVDYHNWAEVYFNGTWHLVDAQKGNWLTPAENYVAFRYYRDESINAVGFAHRFKVSGSMRAEFL